MQDQDLQQIVAKHDAEIHAVNQRLTGIESLLSDLKNYIQAGSETKWPVIISGLGIIITIAVLSLTPIYTQMGKTEARLDNYNKLFIEHLMDKTPVVMQEKTLQNEEDIELLKRFLHRGE